MISSLGVSAPPISPERVAGQEMGLAVHQAYVGSLCKNPNSMGFTELPGWPTHGGVGRVVCLGGQGVRGPLLTHLALHLSSI